MPTVEEWLARTRRRTSGVTRAEVLDALDELRGPWPDPGSQCPIEVFPNA